MQTYLAILPDTRTATVQADGRTLAAAVAALVLGLGDLPVGTLMICIAN